MHLRATGPSRYLAAVLLAAVMAAAGLVLGAGPASAASHHVTISTYSYHPAALTIAVGDTVTWTNLDSVAHDITVTKGPVLFHSPQLSQGQSWSYTFTVAGPYNYICSVHPDMTAILTVAPVPTSAVAAVPSRGATVAVGRTHAATGSVTHPVTALPATAVQTQVAPLDSRTGSTQINPLLLVGGALCAVLIFCLLAMASRPNNPMPQTVAESPHDDTPTRVLPPPPPA